MRNSRWWSYLKEPRKFWADETNQRELKEDIEWWEEQLKAWATGRVATEYPIMSLDAMLEDNSLIQVCCSDASMPDGHGYLYGSLDEDNPAFLSATWQQERKPVSSRANVVGALHGPQCREGDADHMEHGRTERSVRSEQW
jgi:hypothetical protein